MLHVGFEYVPVRWAADSSTAGHCADTVTYDVSEQ